MLAAAVLAAIVFTGVKVILRCGGFAVAVDGPGLEGRVASRVGTIRLGLAASTPSGPRMATPLPGLNSVGVMRRGCAVVVSATADTSGDGPGGEHAVSCADMTV